MLHSRQLCSIPLGSNGWHLKQKPRRKGFSLVKIKRHRCTRALKSQCDQEGCFPGHDEAFTGRKLPQTKRIFLFIIGIYSRNNSLGRSVRTRGDAKCECIYVSASPAQCKTVASLLNVYSFVFISLEAHSIFARGPY